ncbi:MerR family transcriptional regulator [Arcanobacterium bovis]|nr:MerR family transcriptional regulator [Arcanobacterium bovis]
MSRKESGELLTVGEVAKLLKVSVRTLHHWEERSLVVPAERSWTNYRLYSDDDVRRAQHVLVYRAAGMPLDAIAEVLDDVDPLRHLRRQRDLLIEKQTELHNMIAALDLIMEDAMDKNELSTHEIAQILGDTQFAQYQEEAEHNWGETEDWRISQERAQQKTAGEWADYKAKTESLHARLAQAMQKGVEADCELAQTLAEEHRELLSEWFPVSHAKHVIIARGYVGDPRFANYYNEIAPGLAGWLKAAIDSNAHAHGVDPDSAQWQ